MPPMTVSICPENHAISPSLFRYVAIIISTPNHTSVSQADFSFKISSHVSTPVKITTDKPKNATAVAFTAHTSPKSMAGMFAHSRSMPPNTPSMIFSSRLTLPSSASFWLVNSLTLGVLVISGLAMI